MSEKRVGPSTISESATVRRADRIGQENKAPTRHKNKNRKNEDNGEEPQDHNDDDDDDRGKLIDTKV